MSINRDDIHVIASHSNLTEEEIATALEERVYHKKESWQTFLRLFCISLGVGFAVAGVVFFFAYNWAGLNKFLKIGLIEAMLITTISLAVLKTFNKNIRHIVLTGAAVLVGVLFAVFGQIYQTGANAYDFFLAWTLFITLWVVVSDFAPLWLLYLVLINTTFILYTEQVAQDWSEVFVFSQLFIFHSLVLVFVNGFFRKKTPGWLLTTIVLAAASYATIGTIDGIFSREGSDFFVFSLLAVIIFFSAGIWFGIKSRSILYLSVIPFSIIVMVSASLIKGAEGEGMLLTVSLFIIVSITFTIKALVDVQKKWTHDQQGEHQG